MKIRIIFFLLLVVPTLFVSAQTLKIELLDRSDETIDKPIHYHLFKVSNNSNFSQEFNISINNASCEYISMDEQENLIVEMYDENLSKKIGKIELKSFQAKEFYIKTSRRKNTKLSTWSCIEIEAVSKSSKVISNTVSFRSYIPDPENEY